MGTDPSERSARAGDRGSSPAPAVRAAIVLKHLALALALCASTALVIDYQRVGEPAFCGVASACFQVRKSAWSHIAGVPLPHLALPAFAVLMGGSIFATSALHHRLVAAAAGVGALLAALLIGIQATKIGAFCQWCVIVDSSAIVAGLAAIGIAVWTRDKDDRAARAAVQGRSAMAWSLAGALAIALPFVWARFPHIAPPPPEIQVYMAGHKDKVTIVSYTDFECPFCRKLHPTLDAIRDKYKDRIHFLRRMKPLSGHPGALPAARAWVCAPSDAKDQVATALYEMEPGDLRTDKLVDLANKFHLSAPDAFRECMESQQTTSLIERDSLEFARIQGSGLPFTYVNARLVIGLNPDGLTSAVERELQGPSPELPVWGMFALLGAIIVVAGALTWTAKAEPVSARPDEAQEKRPA